MTISTDDVSCIILAGGEGKRVGGVDKGLLEFEGKALVEHVIDRVAPQVDDIVISANRNKQRYQQYSDNVIGDESEQFLGPLAGISAAFDRCKHDLVLIVACDTPFLPTDIIEKFLSSKADAQLYIASSNEKWQLVMLIHKSLQGTVKQSLDNNQLRLMQWASSQRPEIIDFPDDAAFKNFNHNDDFNS